MMERIFRRRIKPWSILLSSTLMLGLTEGLILPSPAVACWFGFFCRPQSVGKVRGPAPGYARRDSDLCLTVDLPLTALVPDTDKPVKTGTAYPVFWFYLPTLAPIGGKGSASKPEIKLKFVLQDEQGQDVYQTRFALPQNPAAGVIGLRFLSPQAALPVGKSYRWYFLMYCNDPDEVNEPTFVEGLIQREALSADRQTQIEQADLQKRALDYAAANLWYDTLITLDTLRSQPTDPSPQSAPQVTWISALQAVGLPAAIAQQPILGRYYVPDNPPQN
jgi:Domain of Unknown Function (DUF928)